jgi:hypothetical protein
VVLRPPRIEVVAADGAQWTLRIHGPAGYPHRIEVSPDLQSWDSVAVTIPDTVPFTWTLPVTGGEGARFLRVAVTQNGNSP